MVATIKKAEEDMIKAGAHFGYSQSTKHPKMSSYIFAVKNGAVIFDLDKIKEKLDIAKEFVKGLGKNKKIILFVCTKRDIKSIAEKYAKELNMLFVTERWLGGTLTNFKKIKERIDYLNDLIEKEKTGELDKYTKKERSLLNKKIEKLERYLTGLKICKEVPSALVVIDSNHEKIAVAEAKYQKVPIVALMNSDCNPTGISYPIPGNDSSLSSVEYFLSELATAYKDGLAISESETEKEEKATEANKETKYQPKALARLGRGSALG